MVKVTFTEGFEKQIKKIRDNSTKNKIQKQIEKVIENPSVGKPLRHDLKGERTLYIKPYRLIYTLKQDEIILLRFLHRDEVYK